MTSRVQQSLTGAAAIVVIATAVGWRSLRSTSGSNKPAVVAVPSPDLTPLMAYAVPLPDSAVTVVAVAESAVVRRDPFGDEGYATALPSRPHASDRATAHASTEWHVSATLIAGARRAAVINDALVYEGDTIPGGGKLMSVERDRVVVTDSHGATHTVTVKEGDG